MNGFFGIVLRVFFMFGIPFLSKWISPWIPTSVFVVIILFSIITLIRCDDNLENVRTASISFISIFNFGGALYFNFFGCLLYVLCVLLGANLVSAIEHGDIIFPSEEFFTSKMVFVLILAAVALLVRFYPA